MTFSQMDETMSLTQQSQYMREKFPPQGSRLESPRQETPVSAKEAKEMLIAHLLAKNNNENEDQGIHTVITCLGSDNILRAMANNKVRKIQLMATWGFFKDMTLEDASSELKDVKVDDLKTKLISEFSKITPDNCLSCSKIYSCIDNEIGAECIICSKKLCPDCCPKIQEGDQFLKTLFPLCGQCVRPKLSLRPEFSSEFSSTPVSQHSGNSRDDFLDGQTNNHNNMGGNKNEDRATVCKFYLKRQCRHYKDKTECKFAHPKLCFAWIKNGKCKDESKCSEFCHPELCSHSLNKKQCTNKKM